MSISELEREILRVIREMLKKKKKKENNLIPDSVFVETLSGPMSLSLSLSLFVPKFQMLSVHNPCVLSVPQ